MKKYLALTGLFVAGLVTAITVNAAPTATTRYVSATGNDANACTQTAPCKTFGRGYAVAASGDTVEVLAGSYPVQNFGTDGGAKALTFHCQAGGKLRALYTHGDNLRFDGCDVDGNGQAPSGSFSSLVENGGGANWQFVNGRAGNVVDGKAALLDGPGILLSNDTFHDAVLRTTGVHMECIQFFSTEALKIVNSTFTNCGVFDITIGYPDWWSPLPPPFGHIVLSGNTFHAPVPADHPTVALWHTKKFGSGCGNGDDSQCGLMDGWTITNNQFDTSVINRLTDAGNNTICGNTGSVDAGWKVACSSPPPTTTSTTTPVTTAPTTTAASTVTVTTTVTQTVTVSDYNPACRPDCDSTITSLRDLLAQIHVLSAP